MDGPLGHHHHVAAHPDAVALDLRDEPAGAAHLDALSISIRCAPVRAATCAHSGPAAAPVAGSSPISAVRRNERARAVPASGSTAAR